MTVPQQFGRPPRISEWATHRSFTMSRSKDWCFTLQLPSDSNWDNVWESLSAFLRDRTTYHCGQVESGTHHHFQGFFQWKTQSRMDSLVRAFRNSVLAGVHLEPRRAPTARAARDYCFKEDTRIAGPWEWGELQSQGKSTAIADLAAAIDGGERLAAVVRSDPATAARCINVLKLIDATKKRTRPTGPRDVVVLTGATGTGKTRRVYTDNDPDSVYSIASYQPVWFDGYDGESVLLLDEFDGTMPLSFLLKITDRMEYKCPCPIKGGFVQPDWTKVYICSNLPISMWYPSETPARLDALMRRVTEHTIL